MSKVVKRSTDEKDIIYFMGSVDATLKAMKDRLTNIEDKIGQTCPAHDSILQMMSTQKETNKGQANENVDVQRHQRIQDTGIRNLEEKDREFEFKLSNKDYAKLLTGIGAMLVPIVAIVTYIINLVIR